MIEPKPPPVRYEHAAAGDLLPIDIKKFARIVKAGHRITGDPRDATPGAGWEFLYVAIDDHSRIAFTAIYPNERAVSAADFLARVTAFFQALHHHGAPRHHRQRALLRLRPLSRDLPHARHRAQTNAPLQAPDQRQSRTLHPNSIREWAYAKRYENSAERLDELLPCTHQYNWHRPHTSLDDKPPITIPGLKVKNC